MSSACVRTKTDGWNIHRIRAPIGKDVAHTVQLTKRRLRVGKGE